MATKKMAMGGGAKTKAAASRPTEAAMAARQTQIAKAGERLKAEEATMSEAGKARIKAAQNAAAAESKRNPGPKAYTDQLSNAIKAKQASMPARPTERIPRPAGTVSPNAAKMVGKPLGGATTMGSRAGVTMTPRIKQGLQNMSDKLRGMPMKKGGKAGKK